jgi:carbonic anhydrase/acetyltransferase-like protein (isoleucine patch superfamily)
MHQSRQRVKELRLAARRGDIDAARALLAHSVVLGHDRLGVRRYFAARFLGASDLDRFKTFCATAAHDIPPEALLAAARGAVRRAGERKDFHLVASELLSPDEPFTLSYAGVQPRLASDPHCCGRNVSLLGRVEIGTRSLLGPGAVVRADGHFVRIGDDFRLGEMSTVHIAHEVYPTIVGHRVTVGRKAVVHACIVGNDCVIEDGVVILDGTKVEDGVLVEAGSIVFPRSVLKTGLVYSGSPAKPIREFESGERERRALIVQDAIAASLFGTTADGAGATDKFGQDAFVAATAQLSGRIEAGTGSSVFFGCRLDAGDTAIVIGTNSNVQDNTIIDASDGKVAIGANTTIGHNVHIRACSIGANALIGIGSSVAPGTVIDEDVLLAAGAVTLCGQYLERGWLWGGRPARPIAKLDDARRKSMLAIVEQYCAYAAAYRLAQSSLVKKGGSNGTSPIANRHPNR